MRDETKWSVDPAHSEIALAVPDSGGVFVNKAMIK